MNKNDVVSISQCVCGGSLDLLPHSPYSTSSICNICWEKIVGEVYFCGTCKFYAHPDCVEIKEKVNVFLHADPLHLLVQNYYENNNDALCDFCEESLQGSEWVYSCKKCNFNVHSFCTKHPTKVNRPKKHSHPLTLVQSSLGKNVSCTCCYGIFKGYRYSCTNKRCTFGLHPLCKILSVNRLCIFDCSHELSRKRPSGFHCGRCGALGFSAFYHCSHCDVKVHPDCLYDVEEKEENWNLAYERVMLECGNKANHEKMDKVSELLNILLVSSGLETISSSRSRPPPGIMRVQPTVQVPTPTSREAHSSSAIFDDVILRQKLAAETEVRKTKRLAAKDARQKERVKWKAELGAKLENLERLLQDLQSSKVEAGALAGTHEKLRKLQEFVQEVITSKMRQVPRIGLIYDFYDGNKLLIRRPAHTCGVRLVLLCEEPGHEHIVRLQRDVTSGCDIEGMDGEEMEKLQLMLISGLQVVKRALSRATQITDLDSLALPELGERQWDLREVYNLNEDHDIRSKMASDDEGLNLELQKTVEDTAAESLQGYFEDNGTNIFDTFGLLRVRYTATEQDDCPRYKRGTIAWLCTEHQNRGLQAGVLEFHPWRIYHNVEYDQERQFL